METHLNAVWNELKPYKKTLFLALLLATTNQVFSLLDPLVFKLIIDNYATQFLELTPQEFFRGVSLLLLLAMGVALISRIAKNFQDYHVNVASQRVGASMYARSIDHVLTLPYEVFEDQRSGETLQKVQKAKVDMQVLIANFVNVFFLSAVGMLFVLAYAFYVHWIVGVAFLASIPVISVSMFWISRRIRDTQRRILMQTNELAGTTTETLRNIELVKSLGLERQEIGRLNSVNSKILGLELKKVRQVRWLSFIQGTIINTTRTILLLLMLWLIYNQMISLGSFFTFIIYSFFIFGPLQQLGEIAGQYQEARASYEQLMVIMRMRPKTKPADAVDATELSEIRFENVSFTYPSSMIPSVNEVSLDLPSGSTIAFAGPSGSGKSTVVKLLLGLYDPTQGRMLINGMDSRKVDLDSFRKRIGLVSQETQLFAGTIRENLLFVKPEATDAECLDVIRLAAAAPIIERGGKGLDTKIGEGGIKISGGERQRIAIARALLRNPELLIFDEATSSLDSLTEQEITATIKKVIVSRPNLTIVLVSHRLSTIAHADVIYVLERGRIVEKGRHDELLQRKGLYEAFWKQQVAEGTVLGR